MEVKVLGVILYRPEAVINNRDYKSFRTYLSKGFYVYDRPPGKYILKKFSKVKATIEHEGNISTINLKREIIQYYGEGQTEELIDRFQKDLKNGQVILEVDSNGYYSIVEK